MTAHPWIKRASPLFTIGAVAVAAVAVVLGIVLPRSAEAALDAQARRTERVEAHMLRLVDLQFSSWAEVTSRLARQIAERPKEGEAVFLTAMELNSEIVQLRVYSGSASDELVVNNPKYVGSIPEVPETDWVRMGLDSSRQIAWIRGGGTDSVLVATRVPIEIGGDRFWLRAAWDASRFSSLLADFPLEQNCLVSLQHTGRIVWKSWLAADSSSADRRIVRSAPMDNGLSLVVAFPAGPTKAEAKESAGSSILLLVITAVVLWSVGWRWRRPRERH